MNAQRRPLDVSIHAVNSVDLCDADSTFIVTVDLGSLTVADSLNLYDVTLRYPADRIRFSQVLFQNTLSEALETKDYGSRANGELRVYGFNIIKPIVGAKALFAVQFKFVGGCTDSTAIGFAALPDMNPEAHVYVRSLSEAVVPLNIVDKPTRSLKLKFSNDTIVFSSVAESRNIECRAQLQAGANVRELGIGLDYDFSRVRIDSIRSAHDTDTLMSESVPNGYRVTLRSKSDKTLADGCGLLLKIKCLNDSSKQSTIHATIFSKDTCACVTRWNVDSTKVLTTFPNVVDAHWSSDTQFTVKSYGDVWELNSHSGSVGEMRVYDLMGMEQYRVSAVSGSTIIINSSLFTKGLYILRYVSSSGLVQQKKIFN